MERHNYFRLDHVERQHCSKMQNRKKRLEKNNMYSVPTTVKIDPIYISKVQKEGTNAAIVVKAKHKTRDHNKRFCSIITDRVYINKCASPLHCPSVHRATRNLHIRAASRARLSLNLGDAKHGIAAIVAASTPGDARRPTT